MILLSHTRNFRQPSPEPSSRRMAFQKWCGRRTPSMRRVKSSMHGYAGKHLRWSMKQTYSICTQSNPISIPSIILVPSEHPYRYRFFNAERGNVLALGAAACVDAPSLSAFSSCSERKVAAVSEVWSSSPARLLPARCPEGVVQTGIAEQARAVFRARRNSSGERDVGPEDVFVVSERYASQTIPVPARGARTSPPAELPRGTPGSHTTTGPVPVPTRAVPRTLLAAFCNDASPTAPV